MVTLFAGLNFFLNLLNCFIKFQCKVPGYAIYKIFDKFIAPIWRMRSQFSQQLNPSALGEESESVEISKRQQKMKKKEEKLEKEGKLIRKTVKQ